MKKIVIAFVFLIGLAWYWIVVVSINTHYIRRADENIQMATLYIGVDSVKRKFYKQQCAMYKQKADDVIKYIPSFLRP
jgi:hypothetical protein